jgi:hypothetical protein
MWLIKLLPFLGRYSEVTAACCGACPTCVVPAVTGIALDVVTSKPLSDD